MNELGCVCGCGEVNRESIQSSRHIKIRTDTLELAGVVP
jgi:hypothetical protein